MKTKIIQNQKQVRDSNIELLRIFAMVLIILFHYVYNGGFDLNVSEFTINKCVLRTLGFGGKLGVELFVLITGYYMSEKLGGGIRRLVKFSLQVSFYALVVFLILGLTRTEMGVRTIAGLLLPIPYNTWWFATSYFCLILLTSFLNMLISAMSKKQHKLLIIILVIVETVMPTFMLANMAYSNLAILIMLYLIGAYIRKYDPLLLRRKAVPYIGIIACACICTSSILIDYIGQYISAFSSYARFFSDLPSCILLIAAVCIFSAFRNLNIGNSTVINEIAVGTFGIYLLHEHELMRKFIWIKIFKTNTYYTAHTVILVGHMLICCMIVFFVGTVVDYMYRKLIERNVLAWLSDIINKFKKRSLIPRIMDYLDK